MGVPRAAPPPLSDFVESQVLRGPVKVGSAVSYRPIEAGASADPELLQDVLGLTAITYARIQEAEQLWAEGLEQLGQSRQGRLGFEGLHRSRRPLPARRDLGKRALNRRALRFVATASSLRGHARCALRGRLRSLRILDVCAFYTPQGGGVRTYVHRKLAAAAAAGHEVIVLSPGQTDGWRELPGGGVLATLASPRLPIDRRYRYFGDEAALHRALDRWRPDVVEASSPWSSATKVARWRGQAARSLIMHADPMSAYAYRWFGRVASTATIDRRFEWFWRHLRRLDAVMDLVVCASADLASRLAAGGLKRTAVLPMGVEPGVFSPSHRDPQLRAQLLSRCALPASATLLLGVGRY